MYIRARAARLAATKYMHRLMYMHVCIRVRAAGLAATKRTLGIRAWASTSASPRPWAARCIGIGMGMGMDMDMGIGMGIYKCMPNTMGCKVLFSRNYSNTR